MHADALDPDMAGEIFCARLANIFACSGPNALFRERLLQAAHQPIGGLPPFASEKSMPAFCW
jgi:hypothetical protein